MNAKFKPLGLAAAVAAVSAGMAGTAHATVANNALGDLAIVPYYTVQNDWATGVHVTNTSNQVQIVKVRVRRGTDSADALDINLIMSPFDVWTGSLTADGDDIVLTTDDSTCTAPAAAEGGRFVMPDINREGAEEGYIEIIGMGSIDGANTIAFGNAVFAGAATHTNGTPAGCTLVRDAFFQNNKGETAPNTNARGTTSNSTALIRNPFLGVAGNPLSGGPNFLPVEAGAAGNSFKVSYFVRDAGTGIEFGNNAVHIADFGASPALSNQQQGLANGDTTGFDYPDLNGTSYSIANAGARTLYNSVIRADLGVAAVLNDWSFAEERGVSTDWVITIPGQYTMIDYTALAVDAADGELDNEDTWDFRDLPVTAAFAVWDREEGTFAPEEGGLVISPSRDPAPDTTLLENEVNVIEWGPDSVAPVLDSELTTRVDTSALDQSFGWAQLAITSNTSVTQQVCEPTTAVAANIAALAWSCSSAEGNVPMAGFVAWQRTFADPSKNYGRIVEHSFKSQ